MADVIPLNGIVSQLTTVAQQWPQGHTLIVTAAGAGTKTQATVTIDNNAKTITLAT